MLTRYYLPVSCELSASRVKRFFSITFSAATLNESRGHDLRVEMDSSVDGDSDAVAIIHSLGIFIRLRIDTCFIGTLIKLTVYLHSFIRNNGSLSVVIA